MISSGANSKIKQLIKWRDKAKERRQDGIYLAEGGKMFLEAPLDRIQEVYISQSLLEANAGEHRNACMDKLSRVPYEVVTEEIFQKISDTQTPQGILTVLKRNEHTVESMLKGCVGNLASAENCTSAEDRKPAEDCTSVADRKPAENCTSVADRTSGKSCILESGKAPLFIILEDIQDPGNLGTIVRTSEGAGVTGIIMSSRTVDIYNPKTIRATMGSVYRVPFCYTDDLPGAVRKLQASGVKVYAAHLKGQEYYNSFDFNQGTAFMIGNEGNGLTKDLADMADSYLKIPMEGRLESLNAAVASALLMYEAHRQRA